MTKPKETFHSNPPIQGKEDWMLGLTDLEINNSIFNITEEINKLKLYKFPDEKSGGISYEKDRDELEKDLDIAPFKIKEYREQVTKGMKDDKYMLNLAMYVDSIFEDFESFCRTKTNLVEDDVRLVLDEYKSSFITYDLEPGIYAFKDISEALFNILHPEYRVYNN